MIWGPVPPIDGTMWEIAAGAILVSVLLLIFSLVIISLEERVEDKKDKKVIKEVVVNNAVELAPLYLEYGHGKELTAEVSEEVKRGYLAGIRDALAIFGRAPGGVQATVIGQVNEHLGWTSEADKELENPPPREEQPLGNVFVSRNGPGVL